MTMAYRYVKLLSALHTITYEELMPNKLPISKTIFPEIDTTLPTVCGLAVIQFAGLNY